MDLVALLTEVALKFASLPGSRFAWIVCHVGRIMGREQELQELGVHVLLWGLGLFLGFPSRCRVGFCLIIPHFICVMSSLAAVIPYSNKVYPFSGVSFDCPFISVLFSCTGVNPLPDRVQRFAVHVPPHSSPSGEFCQTPSVEEFCQYRVSQRGPAPKLPSCSAPSQ